MLVLQTSDVIHRKTTEARDKLLPKLFQCERDRVEAMQSCISDLTQAQIDSLKYFQTTLQSTRGRTESLPVLKQVESLSEAT